MTGIKETHTAMYSINIAITFRLMALLLGDLQAMESNTNPCGNLKD